MKTIVYKDGSYKIVEDKSAWEYQNDPDYLTTIDLESITVAPPVSEEGGIEEIIKEAEKLFKGPAQSDKDGSSELHYIKAGALWEDLRSLLNRASANSVRQQGDDWIKIADGCDMPKSDKPTFAFSALVHFTDGQKVYTGWYCILSESGGWIDALGDCERKNITHWQPIPELPGHQSPSMPQPGFIDQLRKFNPYKDYPPGLYSRAAYNTWNECCDRAAELLEGKGEEGK